MDLCGEAVTHKVFGTGKVVGFVNNYVTVLFDDNKEVKEFVYPSAFGAFLNIENDSILYQIGVDKELIAQEIDKKKRINEVIHNLVLPIKSKKANAKSNKVVKAKSSDGVHGNTTQ